MCVPDVGEKRNKVWQRTVERTWSGPPDEPIQLRYTSSIQFKIKKIAEYRRRGLLGANEPVLIAMNQGAILDSDLNDVELPLAFNVLFGIGKTMLLVQIGTGEAEIMVQPQPTITNANGSEVSSAIFTEPSSSVVSGLILARHSTLDLFDNPGPFLTLAHNPLAQAPLPVDALPLRGELWVEEGRLVHRGVVSSHGRYSEQSQRLPAPVGA
ncbi:MAG TPA: hypothetical protein VGM88_33335 [Kofleriaceae bacterium]|jgi:hypothetical protein